jgi:hypothetical protein
MAIRAWPKTFNLREIIMINNSTICTLINSIRSVPSCKGPSRDAQCDLLRYLEHCVYSDEECDTVILDSLVMKFKALNKT